MDSRERPSNPATPRPVPDHFASFGLTIESNHGVYRARVDTSPAGPRAPIEIEPALLEPAASATVHGENTRDVTREGLERADLQGLGARLFRAIFVGKVAEAYRTSLDRARNHGHGLRLCLCLDEVSELATLAWEALWDPQERAFLADLPDLLIVRTLRIPATAPEISPIEPPLRLLALLPEPRGESKLSGASEWRQIYERLQPLIEAKTVEADRLQPPTLDALDERVQKQPFHVLHIVAHGAPGGAGQGGMLKLVKANGALDEVSGTALMRVLEWQTAPRLVVLNTCHGASSAFDDAFDGMAQHLLSRGIPAVVAMRTAITDEAAVTFAAELYAQLATGRTVESAMVEARRKLSLGEHRSEWATPTLYLRGDNLEIFPRAPVAARSFFAAQKSPSVTRSGWKPAASITAIAAALLAVVVWLNRGEPALCPPIPKLQDLRFVDVGPGVVQGPEGKSVPVDRFCIATKEVSRRDWREVMGEELPRPDWSDDLPITDVTPSQARAFLERLQTRDPGAVYRLPTAAEWEYAARADQPTAYFFGDDESELHRYGNCKNMLASDGYDGPAPVGSYSPNPWGLYDVHGNVAEWIEWPGEPRFKKGKLQAVRLGGSFDNAPANCGFAVTPNFVLADIDNRQDTGLRVVRELSEEERRLSE